MDRVAAFKSIATQASWGELIFPTNVEASLKIKHALEHTDCSAAMAARLVQAEPLLAARTLSIANSVVYKRSGTELTGVLAAVQRVGFHTLSALVSAVIVRQIESKIVDTKLLVTAGQLWQHTVYVAALAQIIARLHTDVDPDCAMFAGIVHEVGGFYMLSRAEEFPGLLDGEPNLWIQHGEAPISRSVLDKLAVPATIVNAIERLWGDQHCLPPESLDDVLAMADALAPTVSPLHPYTGSVYSPSSLSSSSAGLALRLSIMEESAEELRSVVGALL